MLRIAEVEFDKSRPVTVTGGEPLIWQDFLLGLIDVSGDRPLHLETAGHDLAQLAAVMDGFDHISLDLKLPDDLSEPVPSGPTNGALPRTSIDWDALRLGQLDLLRTRPQSACAKLVVTPHTNPSAFATILEDLARVAPQLPLFIAPASPRGSGKLSTCDSLRGVVAAALEVGLEPRVLYQMHRALGVR